MSKCFRLYCSSGHFLNMVVPNGRGRAQRRFYVTGVEQSALLRRVCPHACKTVCL